MLGKDVENRSWTSPYRGLLAIHAGKSVDSDPLAVTTGQRLEQRLPSGCVVATVQLLDVVRDSSSEWARENCYHWVLSDVRQLAEPVPCVGRQALFKLPLDVEARVLEQLAGPSGTY